MSAELSREDRYEAAVRAVLDLCDEAEAYDGELDPRLIRDAIRWELAERVDVGRAGRRPAEVRRERIERVPGIGIRILEEGEL